MVETEVWKKRPKQTVALISIGGAKAYLHLNEYNQPEIVAAKRWQAVWLYLYIEAHVLFSKFVKKDYLRVSVFCCASGWSVERLLKYGREVGYGEET